MKKSVRGFKNVFNPAFNVMAGLVLAAGFLFSGCNGLLEADEVSDSASAVNSFERAAYSATSGIQGSISSVNVTGGKAQGWLNSAYITWTGSNSTVYCDGTAVNSMLTRKIGSTYRCDIPGLKAGSHTIKVGSISATVNVASHDRSGFAFYGSTNPGAYKADGTLKDNAVVLYITENTKDTVTLDVVTSSKGTTTSCTGIQPILDAFKKGYDSRPLCIRIIGKVTTPSVSTAGDLMISGSSSSKHISNGITVEGIGHDATAYGWGIRIKNADFIEVSNLGFMMVNSDEGDNVSLQQDCKNVWVHNCDMFYGEAGGDKDQAKGDGALDCKKSTYVTFSYNHFWDSGKCNLLGLSEGTTEGLYITYHHNWYDHSDSRHPRVRFYSAHVYNNYYDGNAKYGAGACLGSSVFMDSNYFRNCKYPMMTSMQGSDVYGTGSKRDATNLATFSKENGGSIKAYNNTMTGTYTYVPYGSSNSRGIDTTVDFDAYQVSSRTQTVPSSVKSYAGSNTYNNFDTSSIMYSYTADAPETAMNKVKKYAGRIEGGDFQYTFPSDADTNYGVDQTLKSKLASYTGASTATGSGSATELPSEGTGGSSSGDSGSSESSGSTGSSGSSDNTGSTGSSGSSGSGNSDSSITVPTSAVALKAEGLSTGSLTSNTAYGTFTVLATSAKPVKITSNSLTYNSNSYTKCFDLGGGADGVTPTYRAVKFSAGAGSSITIVANAGSERTLNLSDGSKVLSSVKVGTSATALNYKTETAGTFYVYSSSSSIKIYEIYVSEGSSTEAAFTTIELNSNTLTHGTFTSNVTSGAFTIYATSAKPVSTPYANSSLNGKTFTQNLSLGGGGSAGSYRCIGFKAVSGCTVTAYAYGASGRYLALVKSDGTIADKKEVSSTLAQYTYSVPADGTYYLMSTASGINVNYVKVSK
ncbi:polysaccharide lyase family 1 protein [Treponema berlinense]|uniref:pectate lyase family protein n=1 Tax=Treponema berlinense TaxID=225004 RepID=UPI0026EA534D|nr:hypothetical protein [Treponema berlinense]